MQPSIIKYSQEFKSFETGNRWYGIEIEVNENDDPIEAYQKAETIINQAHKKLNPHLYADYVEGGYGSVTAMQSEGLSKKAKYSSHEQYVQEEIKEIEACDHISIPNKYGRECGLLSFEASTKEDPRIQAAYDKRLKELQ